jgi:hypothetical protein
MTYHISAGLCLSEIKLAHTDDEVRQEMALCLPQIKPEHIGDAVHPRSHGVNRLAKGTPRQFWTPIPA